VRNNDSRVETARVPRLFKVLLQEFSTLDQGIVAQPSRSEPGGNTPCAGISGRDSLGKLYGTLFLLLSLSSSVNVSDTF